MSAHSSSSATTTTSTITSTTTSSSTSSSSRPETASGYTWIMEHIMINPQHYEIPLRTMYAINSSAQAKQGHFGPPPEKVLFGQQESEEGHFDGAGTGSTSQTTLQQEEARSAMAQFKSNLLAHVAAMPSQPCSLPPSFITAFVRRCYAEELVMIDFPQALTALDYLRDLDLRLRREFMGVQTRLGVDPAVGLAGWEDGAGENLVVIWLKSLFDRFRDVEMIYPQVYIGLRRWSLINEMSLPPFNKANCLAMLNTLHPPASASPPTKFLTTAMLREQRGTFFRYIKAVESNGPAILQDIMKQGARLENGEETGWPMVRETLDLYLSKANAIIDDCSAVIGVESILQRNHIRDRQRYSGNTDSGVSFSSTDRPISSGKKTHQREKPVLPNLSTDTNPSPSVPAQVVATGTGGGDGHGKKSVAVIESGAPVGTEGKSIVNNGGGSPNGLGNSSGNGPVSTLGKMVRMFGGGRKNKEVSPTETTNAAATNMAASTTTSNKKTEQQQQQQMTTPTDKKEKKWEDQLSKDRAKVNERKEKEKSSASKKSRLALKKMKSTSTLQDKKKDPLPGFAYNEESRRLAILEAKSLYSPTSTNTTTTTESNSPWSPSALNSTSTNIGQPAHRHSDGSGTSGGYPTTTASDGATTSGGKTGLGISGWGLKSSRKRTISFET